MHKASIIAVKRSIFAMVYTITTDLVQRKQQAVPQYFHSHESINSVKVTGGAKYLLLENAALQF